MLVYNLMGRYVGNGLQSQIEKVKETELVDTDIPEVELRRRRRRMIRR